MKVLRIEKNGQGPFTSSDISCNPTCARPTPSWEQKFFGGIFGFQSVNEMRGWFGYACRKLLQKKGYSFSVYEAKEFLIDRKQVAFKKETAELLCSFPLVGSFRDVQKFMQNSLAK